MKNNPRRLCIYTKDVQKITGKSDRYSRDLLHRIMHKLNRGKDQFVTVEEFCQHTGLSYEKVREMIKT